MKKYVLFLFASVLGIVFCFATTEHVKIEKYHSVDSVFVLSMPVEVVSVDSLNGRFNRQFNEAVILEKLISCKKIKQGYTVSYGTYCKDPLLNCHLERNSNCKF